MLNRPCSNRPILYVPQGSHLTQALRYVASPGRPIRPCSSETLSNRRCTEHSSPALVTMSRLLLDCGKRYRTTDHTLARSRVVKIRFMELFQGVCTPTPYNVANNTCTCSQSGHIHTNFYHFHIKAFLSSPHQVVIEECRNESTDVSALRVDLRILN